MQWDEVAKQGLVELGRHGPDGLVVAIMFAFLLLATWRGINGIVSLVGLGMLCVLYVVLRWMSLGHAVTLARLSVDAQAARVTAAGVPSAQYWRDSAIFAIRTGAAYRLRLSR
jgi:hypothetical protein